MISESALPNKAKVRDLKSVSSVILSKDTSREENNPLKTSERGTFCSRNIYHVGQSDKKVLSYWLALHSNS
jgi:hypothetical protein